MAWYSLFAHARNIPGFYGIRKITNIYRTLNTYTYRVCSCNVVDRQRWLSFLQVICSRSPYRMPFQGSERRESCLSRSSDRLYATCTTGEMCFCGYLRVLACRSATKFCPFSSTVSWGSVILDDLEHLVERLRTYGSRAERVIVYCRSLDMCADLYEHFHCSLGDSSYYSAGSKQVSDNRLFGMYHANTSLHNEEVILQSMQKEDGVVRVVFATIALGMGVNFAALNTIYHYGAPRSIDDFFQESGRAGRTGAQAKSVVHWKRSDAPLKSVLTNPRDAEVSAVRRYLENTTTCCRFQFLDYFDPELARLPRRDRALCCDVCAATLTPELVAG